MGFCIQLKIFSLWWLLLTTPEEAEGALPLASGRSQNGHGVICLPSGTCQQAVQFAKQNDQYAPVVTVVYSNDVIQCSSHANPQATSYEIILNGTIILETFNTSGYSVNFNPDFCTTVTCNVTNTIGTGTATLLDPVCPDPNGLDARVIAGIVVAVAVLIGAVAAGILIYLVKRRREVVRRNKQNIRVHQLPEEHPVESDPISTNNQGTSTQSAGLVFSRDLIVLESRLGSGQFGTVWLGKVHGIEEDGKQTEVAIKTHNEAAGKNAKEQILAELEMMKTVCTMGHPNVIKLLGYCVETDPVYIIVECCAKGDLLGVLRGFQDTDLGKAYSKRDADPSSIQSLSLTLLQFARDIANGMEFLSSQKCVLRDLTARKVLVAENMVCKLADFRWALGATKPYVDEDDCGRLVLHPPFRWMALESFQAGRFSTETDVWSFGIVLWEILTLGRRPFTEMSGMSLGDLLENGYRLLRPHHCSEELYAMMRSCWQENPQDRPTFLSLSQQLDEMLSQVQIDSAPIITDETQSKQETVCESV